MPEVAPWSCRLMMLVRIRARGGGVDMGPWSRVCLEVEAIELAE